MPPFQKGKRGRGSDHLEKIAENALAFSTFEYGVRRYVLLSVLYCACELETALLVSCQQAVFFVCFCKSRRIRAPPISI